MKTSEVLAMVDALKDNQYTAAQKIAWLSEIDGLIYKEMVLTHENEITMPEDPDNVPDPFTGYTDTDTDVEMLVPFPYFELYRWFLESKIDMATGEIAKYNNSVSMFNNAYQTYQNYYNRTHMPLTGATHFNL